MKKPFSPPSWAGPKWRVIQIVLKSRNVSIPNSHIGRGFALTWHLPPFMFEHPNFAIVIFINRFKKDRAETLFPICLAHRWYTGLPVFWSTIGYTVNVFLVCVYTLYCALVYGIYLTWYTVTMQLVYDLYMWVYGAFPFCEPLFSLSLSASVLLQELKQLNDLLLKDNQHAIREVFFKAPSNRSVSSAPNHTKLLKYPRAHVGADRASNKHAKMTCFSSQTHRITNLFRKTTFWSYVFTSLWTYGSCTLQA